MIRTGPVAVRYWAARVAESEPSLLPRSRGNFSRPNERRAAVEVASASVPLYHVYTIIWQQRV